MTDEEFARRKRELIDEERKNPPGWWYLSFANDDEFLGAAIVQGQGPITAVDRSWRLGINPGDCQVLQMQLDDEAIARVPPEAREKLLSKSDLERLIGPVDRVSVDEDS